MKEHIWTGLIATAIAAVSAYFQQIAIPVVMLIAAMIADYITGMMRAWYTKTLSSRVGLRGIVKKLAYLFAVAVGIVVDWVIQSAVIKTGLDISIYFVGLLLTVWLVLNECISILENLADLGTPVPGWLLKLIARLKHSAESEGNAGVGDDESVIATQHEQTNTTSDKH